MMSLQSTKTSEISSFVKNCNMAEVYHLRKELNMWHKDTNFNLRKIDQKREGMYKSLLQLSTAKKKIKNVRQSKKKDKDEHHNWLQSKRRPDKRRNIFIKRQRRGLTLHELSEVDEVLSANESNIMKIDHDENETVRTTSMLQKVVEDKELNNKINPNNKSKISISQTRNPADTDVDLKPSFNELNHVEQQEVKKLKKTDTFKKGSIDVIMEENSRFHNQKFAKSSSTKRPSNAAKPKKSSFVLDFSRSLEAIQQAQRSKHHDVINDHDNRTEGHPQPENSHDVINHHDNLTQPKFEQHHDVINHHHDLNHRPSEHLTSHDVIKHHELTQSDQKSQNSENNSFTNKQSELVCLGLASERLESGEFDHFHDKDLSIKTGSTDQNIDRYLTDYHRHSDASMMERDEENYFELFEEKRFYDQQNTVFQQRQKQRRKASKINPSHLLNTISSIQSRPGQKYDVAKYKKNSEGNLEKEVVSLDTTIDVYKYFNIARHRERLQRKELLVAAQNHEVQQRHRVNRFLEKLDREMEQNKKADQERQKRAEEEKEALKRRIEALKKGPPKYGVDEFNGVPNYVRSYVKPSESRHSRNRRGQYRKKSSWAVPSLYTLQLPTRANSIYPSSTLNNRKIPIIPGSSSSHLVNINIDKYVIESAAHALGS